MLKPVVGQTDRWKLAMDVGEVLFQNILIPFLIVTDFKKI